ncbi:sigma factor G inhibitor Gin [Clostridium nigeriense]|uniref:sigma factor G inhibitor Gin n=1 Tax=Clostridium nigeriense TaxID=1805470 RepID=UPI003D32D558
MNLNIKSIDYEKNKCSVCGKKIYEDDIIINRRLLCHECNEIISNIDLDNIEYNFYKQKIKQWLLSKYNLIA